MKKITLILLALCLALSVFAVACTPANTDDTTTPNVGGDVTDGPDTQGGAETNAPSSDETVKDTEDDAFISIAPSNDDDKWGDLVVNP